MRGKKEIAILFFLIAVLAFYISSREKEKTHYTLPEIRAIQKDDISRIIIRKKDSEIPLIKEKDNWLVGQEKFPADSHGIENILSKIIGLSLSALVSESANYSLYELDSEHSIEVLAYKGDDLLRRLTVGKPAPSYRHTFMMLNDDERVFHADGNIRSDFDRTVSDLRDKTVLSFKAEITEIVIEKDKEVLKISKAPTPAPSGDSAEKEQGAEKAVQKWTTADGRAVNNEEVDGLIRTLSGFKCDEFMVETKKEDLSHPVYTIILKGDRDYSISLFEKKDNRYPAVSSESEYPFLISEWKAEKIMKDLKVLAGHS